MFYFTWVHLMAQYIQKEWETVSDSLYGPWERKEHAYYFT